MKLKIRQPITQITIDRAKSYLEHHRIAFFDFFRNCMFAFVHTEETKGYYVHVVRHENDHLECICNCREVKGRKLCSHGLAVYLKAHNWPNEKDYLPEAFEVTPWADFFSKIDKSLYKAELATSDNPKLLLEDADFNPRMADYLGFGRHRDGNIAKRDRRAREDAMLLTRDTAELRMLEKGMPSAKVAFEESNLFALCKLLFWLEREGNLKLSAEVDEKHQVHFHVKRRGNTLFAWIVPLEMYIRGMQTRWDYWSARLTSNIERQALPVIYNIAFDADNNLLVEPHVEVATDTFVPTTEVAVEGLRHWCYHPMRGYFTLATGLSPFEFEYAGAGKTTIAHNKVPSFLKQYRDDFRNLDRTLMDEQVFGEVLANGFDRIVLHLIDFNDGLFTYDVEAFIGETQFSREVLRTHLVQGERYTKLAGKIFDTNSFDAIFLAPLLRSETTDQLKPATLFRFLAFFKGRLEVKAGGRGRDVYEKLSAQQAPEVPSLDHTKLSLRPYQQTGYEWLSFLWSFGLSGLLCDQMGLGKTHQGMALAAGIIGAKADASVLIIAPTSVLFHWQDKIRRFCPGLTTIIHHGPERETRVSLKYQIILTSYTLARNDEESFRNHQFDLILFDEIQNVKNAATKNYKALARYQAECKIGLTGTPIENYISELKALMDLVFPGYLGTDQQFRRFFMDPILKLDDKGTKDRLKEVLNPFMLRRAKSEVLTELPEKTEELLTFPLGDYESELYQKVKIKGKEELGGLEEKQTGTMHIFTLIDKLKTICDHPALYHKSSSYKDYPSAKWDLCMEIIDEALASGEKVVIFTQYLGMVDLFIRKFEDEGIGYASITGSTKNREAEQFRFQNHGDCKVFIGSIMAAGVGIDLTAAGVLIHYDRWWNPAREEQATDRIHRIGQTRNVQIYKFQARHTVEERINHIIESKRALVEDLVAFDSGKVGKNLSMQDLLGILA